MSNISIYRSEAPTITKLDTASISKEPANLLRQIEIGISNVKQICYELNEWINQNTNQRSPERLAIYTQLETVLGIKKSTFQVYASQQKTQSLIKIKDSTPKKKKETISIEKFYSLEAKYKDAQRKADKFEQAKRALKEKDFDTLRELLS